MEALTKEERALFRKLSTPLKIQDYLDTLPINHEKQNDTCYSPREVIRKQKAHCLEGALFAAAVLFYNGYPPLVMNLRTVPKDDDHAMVLFKVGTRYGALSKTNHATLRYRDPVYRDPREVALSYFHEYFSNETGTKSLRAYSVPLDMRKFGTDWITEEKPLWKIAHALRDSRHLPIAPKRNLEVLRKVREVERAAGRLVEWKRSDPRT